MKEQNLRKEIRKNIRDTLIKEEDTSGLESQKDIDKHVISMGEKGERLYSSMINKASQEAIDKYVSLMSDNKKTIQPEVVKSASQEVIDKYYDSSEEQ